jgi:enoyl-CoA hydratase/carnithine racemase
MLEITLEGPAKNALSSDLLRGLKEQVRAAGSAPLLITGAGDAFSAGLDLRELVALEVDTCTRFLNLLVETVRALFEHPGPTVALINGHAIAGGCVVALACDLRVAGNDPGILMGLNEVAVGVEFPPELLALVRHRLPAHRVDEAVLVGALHGVQEALRLGLVDRVSEEPEREARRLLEQLSGHDREAFAANKLQLRAGIMATDPALQAAFLERGLKSWCSPALKARVAAMLRR